ncbi:hypothetical protein AB0G64_09320 [Streptomyces longwoodensis]|uniref:hypothetical protein n=1 Tax=Streptomyces longwoodensis TaxID=68231 RepID=UPI00340618BE
MPYPAARPAPPNGPGHCPRCLEPVIWATTTANRRTLAVNPQRDPTGNQALRQDAAGRWLVRQITRERPIPEHDEHLHKLHLLTCTAPAPPKPRRPAAPRHRRGVRPNPRWSR